MRAIYRERSFSIRASTTGVNANASLEIPPVSSPSAESMRSAASTSAASCSFSGSSVSASKNPRMIGKSFTSCASPATSRRRSPETRDALRRCRAFCIRLNQFSSSTEPATRHPSLPRTSTTELSANVASAAVSFAPGRRTPCARARTRPSSDVSSITNAFASPNDERESTMPRVSYLCRIANEVEAYRTGR